MAIAPISISKIPRWRGFNLIELFQHSPSARFQEADFARIAEWGFNFVRLPLSYWNWADPLDVWTIRPWSMRPIDEAIEWGRQYGIHVNLSMHRIPGYCVNASDKEPFRLFGEDETGRKRALAAAKHHWGYFAERYRGIPSSRLSFDLLNEPPRMREPALYEWIVRELIATIRGVDPDRLIFVNGHDLGQRAVSGLVQEAVVQSTRGYLPKAVTHYAADWVPRDEFESFAMPAWPFVDDSGKTWDRERLRVEMIAEWKALWDSGVAVHVGEWGCYSNTSHEVALAWMSDILSLWSETGWGWALWNLRGSFGVMDSGRKDVRYERLGKHSLDRKMLELLRAN